jgi:phenylalanyl-tRNA synthetase beta chain
MAQSGRKDQLLNEQTLELQSDVLLIADDERPLAMAGIMGGEDSGITPATTELFLESAFFAPQAIAGRARRYGFVSDASHRFERGVDFAATRRALERATRLVLEICGGQAGPVCAKRWRAAGATAGAPAFAPACRQGSRAGAFSRANR